MKKKKNHWNFPPRESIKIWLIHCLIQEFGITIQMSLPWKIELSKTVSLNERLEENKINKLIINKAFQQHHSLHHIIPQKLKEESKKGKIFFILVSSPIAPPNKTDPRFTHKDFILHDIPSFSQQSNRDL